MRNGLENILRRGREGVKGDWVLEQEGKAQKKRGREEFKWRRKADR
jgi:hypothetical protein